MTFLFTLILIGFLVYMNIRGDQKPILYLINTIILILFAAANLTAKGNDWVNIVWGLLMFALAIYCGNLYFKYRHKRY